MNKLANEDYALTLITIVESVINEENFNYNGERIDTLYLEIDEKGKSNMYMWNNGFCATKSFLDQEITVTEKAKDKCNLNGPISPIINSHDDNEDGTICVPDSKKLTIINALTNVKYQYYVSTSNVILQGGQWEDMTTNEITINTEGTHYVYARGIEDNVIGSISEPVEVCIDNTVYDVTIPEAEGGSLTASPNSGKINTIITVSDTANKGYRLSSITAIDMRNNAVNITSNKTIKMRQRGLTIAPRFEKIAYTVTKATATNGSFTVSKATANYGDQITITPTANMGYEVNTVTVKDANNKNVTVTSNKFTMPASNVTVTVTFKKINYAITLSSGTGGTISVSKNPANYGDTITITPKPDTNYQVKTITVKDASNNNVTVTNNQFIMPAKNITVSAIWELSVRYIKKTRSLIRTDEYCGPCSYIERTWNCTETTNYYKCSGTSRCSGTNSSTATYACQCTNDSGTYGTATFSHSACTSGYWYCTSGTEANGLCVTGCPACTYTDVYSDWSTGEYVVDCTPSLTVSCDPI